MNRILGVRAAVLGASLAVLVLGRPAGTQTPRGPASKTPVTPQSRLVQQRTGFALNYLVNQQRTDGSWGPGEGVGVTIPFDPRQVNAPPPSDVANTCIAALALLRGGSTPKQGTYSRQLLRAVEFVCSRAEKGRDDSLSIADPGQTTQVQRKIGTNVDTFLAILLLAELKGQMPDDRSETRVARALQALIERMERHQQEDGTWTGKENQGAWAPVLSQALATRAVNRARQAGVPVAEEVLEKSARYAIGWFEKHAEQWNPEPPKPPPAKAPAGSRPAPSGGAKAAAPPALPAAERVEAFVGAAGISLYAVASNLGALQAYHQTRRQIGSGAQNILDSPNSTDAEKQQARQDLKRLEDAEKVLDSASRYVARKLLDPQFIRGFGSDGGEEYLSFIFIGETVRAQNLKEWTTWNNHMTERLLVSQNRDGSWSGKHCITGQTFCTATAVMILLTERLPAASRP
jgi:hypothetical protein